MPDPAGDAASTPADDLAGSAAARPEAVDDAASVGEPELPFGAVRADVPADVPTDVCPLLVLIGPSTDVPPALEIGGTDATPGSAGEGASGDASSRWAMTPSGGAPPAGRPGPPSRVARRSPDGRVRAGPREPLCRIGAAGAAVDDAAATRLPGCRSRLLPALRAGHELGAGRRPARARPGAALVAASGYRGCGGRQLDGRRAGGDPFVERPCAAPVHRAHDR